MKQNKIHVRKQYGRNILVYKLVLTKLVHIHKRQQMKREEFEDVECNRTIRKHHQV